VKWGQAAGKVKEVYKLRRRTTALQCTLPVLFCNKVPATAAMLWEIIMGICIKVPAKNKVYLSHSDHKTQILKCFYNTLI